MKVPRPIYAWLALFVVFFVAATGQVGTLMVDSTGRITAPPFALTNFAKTLGDSQNFDNLTATNNVTANNAFLTPNGDGWYNSGSAAFGNGNFNINNDGSVVDNIGGNPNYEFVVDGQGNLRADSLSVNSGAASISASGLIFGTLSPTNLLSGGAAPAQVLTWNGSEWIPMNAGPGSFTNLPSYVLTNNQITPTYFYNHVFVLSNIYVSGFMTASTVVAAQGAFTGNLTLNNVPVSTNPASWFVPATNGTATNLTIEGVHITSGLIDSSTGPTVISNPVVYGVWPTANLPMTSSNYSGIAPTNTFPTNITTGVTIDTSTGRIWWYYNSTWQ